MPIRDLAKLLRSGDISCVELTELFLDRLERIGPRYNALVNLTRMRASRMARKAADELRAGRDRGLLHGIPFGLKDLFATSGGIPTTWGAAPLKNQCFDFDATVLSKLEEAGSILIGKLALVELAGAMAYTQPNAAFTGPGVNPWSTSAWSGGSSSGSASAVSGGLTPFAIGSETWGSIISPSNHCGISGLRPTYGRVSRFGGMPLAWTLDKVGPMCLTADDCGIVLDAIAGHDPRDPGSSPRQFQYDSESRDENRRYRLGIIEAEIEAAEPGVAANFQRSIDVLRAVADFQKIELPALPYEATILTIMMAESADSFDDLTESGLTSELTAPEDRWGPYARSAILAKDYIRAQRVRGVIAKAADYAMADVDAVIAPSRPTPATPIDQPFRDPAMANRKDLIGALGNLAGIPAISVCSGFAKNGLPTGVQFVGRAYEENTILSIAREYQTITDWHLQHPRDP
jgi:aspartyl-tRNA(Asn)/glutamyl-tRNA(Gln) amidotransferase subunit A